MNQTAISWTDVTWNPVHGCSRVSEGCRNCYAERLSLQKGFTTLPWTKANEQANVLLKPHKLRDPYRLKVPSRIFVNSTSDLFHPVIPDEYRARIFAVMADLQQHTFQILTKRPEGAVRWTTWPVNVWMGTSVENVKALHRLEILRDCGAHTKFISFEPLLEDLRDALNLSGYHWSITGGESGPGFRPMPHRWARHIRDACLSHNVAHFFKQSAAPRTELGTSLQHEDGTFWTWAQYPGQLPPPTPAPPHRLTYED